jgi:hypothetical protein
MTRSRKRRDLIVLRRWRASVGLYIHRSAKRRVCKNKTETEGKKEPTIEKGKSDRKEKEQETDGRKER